MQSRRNAAAPRANAEARSKPSRSAPRQTRSAVGRPPARRFLAGPRVAALAAILLVVSAPGGPTPQGELIDAGLSAYRAFAAGSDVPVEFRAGDPDALTKWLAPQFARGSSFRAFRRTRSALRGGRIAPA